MLIESEQLKKIIEESNYILLVFNAGHNGDTIASALALKHYLSKLHKQADIAASGFVLPKNMKFLAGSETIQPELAHLQKFIVKIDVSKAPIETLSYEVKDDWLSIYLTPKHGAITKNELRTAQSTFKYDLIITLGTPDLESLGDIFFNNTDLFYRTPIVTFDHQPNNERYGQINIIDMTAAAVSEVVYKQIKRIGDEYFDETLATTLLTGMIWKTKSFTGPQITPHTLSVASELVARGADREKIITHLYRTRSVAGLRLWGAALSHLEHDATTGLVHTTITHNDFVHAGATPEDLRGITEELLSHAPEAKIIAVMYENGGLEKKIYGLITAEKNHDALALVKPLNPTGTRHQASVVIENKSLLDAKDLILKTITENAK